MTLTRDGIAGLVCLAISIVLLFLTVDLPPAVMVPIGPAFYPRVVLILLAFLSLILLAGELRGRPRRTAAAVPDAAAARAAAATPANATPASATPASAPPNPVAPDLPAPNVATPAASPAATERPNYRLVLATFVLFGVYVVILPWVGFRIATFLFVAALQPTLEWPRSRQRWLLVVAVAIATALACHFIFEDYLSVLLPRGRWSGM